VIREHRAAPVPDSTIAANRVDQLCRSVERIVADEPRAFAELRGAPDGRRAWGGRVVPVTMTECRVEGDYYPGASYVCHGHESWGGDAAALERPFRELARDLDQCLGRPSWGGRGWERGQTFSFAGGERLITWRYGGNVQRPALTLKIEEDIGRDLHYLRLAVLTMH
jgi:hypothetical protein